MDPENIEGIEDGDDGQELREIPTSRAKAAPVDDVDKAGRTITVICNDDTVDEYDTVILPRGLDLKPYQSNPVFLWHHRAEMPPLGKAIWTAIRDGKTRTKAKIRFDTDPFSELIFSKYESGSMNAVSIRFDPDWESSGPPTPEELKARPDWKRARCIYRKAVLKEISAVTLPGNVNCLKEAVERGLVPFVPDELRDAVARMTPPPATDVNPGVNDGPAPGLPSLRGAITYHQFIAAHVQAARSFDLGRHAREMTQDTIDRVRGRI